MSHASKPALLARLEVAVLLLASHDHYACEGRLKELPRPLHIGDDPKTLTKQEALYHLSSHVTDELWFNRLCKVAGFAERDSDFLDCHEVAQVASDMLEEDGLLASVFVGIIGVRCRLVLRYSGRHPFCNRSAYKDSLDRLVSFAGTQRYAGHNLISFMPTRHSGLYTYGHNPRRMSR